MNLADLSNALFTTLKVVGSTIAGPHNAVLVGGDGIGGLSTENNANGEKTTDSEAYGALGLVVRPRPPVQIDEETISAEAFSVRTVDGLIPLSWRDVRLNRVFPAPKAGTIALVGYGGGFLSLEDTPDTLRTAVTLYVPYGDKAMAIAIDPDQESIMLLHGDGYAVILDADNGITQRSKTGASWTNLKDDSFKVVAQTISLQGNVALGANTAAAIPLLPGPASQPTPSVFFSPT